MAIAHSQGRERLPSRKHRLGSSRPASGRSRSPQGHRGEGSMRVALDDKSTVEDRLFGTARAGGTGRRSTRLAAGPSPAGYRLSARQRPGSSGLRRAARPCCLCQDQCPAHPRSEEGYPPPTSLSAILNVKTRRGSRSRLRFLPALRQFDQGASAIRPARVPVSDRFDDGANSCASDRTLSGGAVRRSGFSRRSAPAP